MPDLPTYLLTVPGEDWGLRVGVGTLKKVGNSRNGVEERGVYEN